MTKELDNSVGELLERDMVKAGKTSFWNSKATKTMAYLMLVISFGLAAFGVYGVVRVYPAVKQWFLTDSRPDNEIEQLAQFIVQRNSKTPVELAEVEARLIYRVAKEKGVPVALVVGIVEKESLYNPFSVSSVGAMGLMQVLIGNGGPVDPLQAHGIEYNLRTGVGILHEKLVAAKGDLNRALELYSGGAGGYTEGVLVCMGRYILYLESVRQQSGEHHGVGRQIQRGDRGGRPDRVVVENP